MEGTDIRKRYRTGEVEVEVLKGIDFQIFQGEFIVILVEIAKMANRVFYLKDGQGLAKDDLIIQDPNIKELKEGKRIKAML